MARRHKKGRPLTGIIVVDKPTGRSSNHVLQQVKRLFNAQKAGHTGNLDPLATGVLPICLGEATKLSGYLLDGDKRYLVTCRLGIATDSADSDGQVIAETDIPELTESMLEEAIKSQLGEQQQIPPMFSALKVNGQPLYKLARQGIEVERKARTVYLHQITLLDWNTTEFTLDVTCSKGTYIRTLVEQISEKLGTLGHVTMLRRIESAGYLIEQSVSIEQIEQWAEAGLPELDKALLPSEEALPTWPRVSVTGEQAEALRQGQKIQIQQAFEQHQVRLFDEKECFLGLGEMSETGTISPKRVFVIPDIKD